MHKSKMRRLVSSLVVLSVAVSVSSCGILYATKHTLGRRTKAPVTANLSSKKQESADNN
jgi:hypothetical protein